jgi:gluconokinase
VASAPIYILMGVSGCGKSTVGKLLAEKACCKFYDGDDFHRSSNIAKMKSGTPLTDEDRRPWLDSLRELIDGLVARGEGGVIACSALKKSYRDILGKGLPVVRFVYLKGDYELFKERLTDRKGHFMKTGLLQSQFDTLEEPHPSEGALTVDASKEPGAIAGRIRELVGK